MIDGEYLFAGPAFSAFGFWNCCRFLVVGQEWAV
jgi:hypothetical protein